MALRKTVLGAQAEGRQGCGGPECILESDNSTKNADPVREETGWRHFIRKLKKDNKNQEVFSTQDSKCQGFPWNEEGHLLCYGEGKER